MLRFTRKTEYALLAIEHMIGREEQKERLTSAREVADAHHIPLPLLAKVMQQLAIKGLVKSVQGTKGGYVLAKKPGDISVADIAEVFEGPLAVAECFKDEKITCPQWNSCLIKDPFYELNQKIYHLLEQTTVADLAHRPDRPAVQEIL